MKRFFKALCLVFAVMTLSLSFGGCAKHLDTAWSVRQNITSQYKQYERMEWAVIHNTFSTADNYIKEIWINVEENQYKSVKIAFDFGTSSASFTRKNVTSTYTNSDVKASKDGWICIGSDLDIAYNYVKISLDYQIKVYEVVFVLDNGELTETKFIGQQIWLTDKNSQYLTADELNDMGIKNTGANLIDEQKKFKK